MLKIAFIAHDRKKDEIVNFATAYEHVFTDHQLYSTGTTGLRIMEQTKLQIHRFMSGPLGETSKSEPWLHKTKWI
uniref:Methylglyoxal synthase n=1 Tax=Paenibacillus brasilensis TaxID=128574 RepID=A0A3Q8GWP2_9BACL|nr:Methylglyoxal synthase [Paenibacillus brasilensis]